MVPSFLSLLFLQTKLYTEDWIGLKTLEDAGRVKYISVPGNHLSISKSDIKKYVVPYLKHKASRKKSIGKDSGIRVDGAHRGVVQGNKERAHYPPI